MKKLLTLGVVLALSCVAFGQAMRFDSIATKTAYINGQQTVSALGGARVQVCTYPANSVPCTNLAVIYTGIDGQTACTGSNGCSNPVMADVNGNFGFWGSAGKNYSYTYTSGAYSFGPFNVTFAASGVAGTNGTNGTNGINGTNGAPGVPGYSPNQIVSGCGVVYSGTGLTYNVSPCNYIIQGNPFSTPLTTVTLPAADPTNDRFDVIAVDKTGAVVVVPGTPQVNPVPPSLDATSQLQLTFASVQAGALVPAGVVTTDMYHNNLEWPCTTSANLNCDSTNNPRSGSKDIEATNAATGNFFRLTIPSGTIDLGTRDILVLWVRNKAALAAARSFTLQWFNGTTAKCTPVSLANGNFVFSGSNTTAYQQIVIPLKPFFCGGVPVTRLQVTVAGTGTNIGAYFDDIILQGGVPQAVGSTGLNPRGAWSGSVAYAPNDLVFYSGGSWYALQSNTNSVPTLSNTNWFSIGAVAPFIDNSCGTPAQNGTIRMCNNSPIVWEKADGTTGCGLKLDNNNNWSFDSCGFSMTEMDFISEATSAATTPAAGHITEFADTASGFICGKDSSGAVHCPVGLRTCMLQVGDGTNTVLSGDYSPFKTSRCYIPYDATILEVEVQTDAGTPSIQLERRRGAATLADLMSGALAAAGTTRTCARASTAQTCYDGTTSSGSITLSNSTTNAGDYIEVKSGTASTETSATIAITFQPR